LFKPPKVVGNMVQVIREKKSGQFRKRKGIRNRLRTKRNQEEKETRNAAKRGGETGARGPAAGDGPYLLSAKEGEHEEVENVKRMGEEIKVHPKTGSIWNRKLPNEGNRTEGWELGAGQKNLGKERCGKKQRNSGTVKKKGKTEPGKKKRKKTGKERSTNSQVNCKSFTKKKGGGERKGNNEDTPNQNNNLGKGGITRTGERGKRKTLPPDGKNRNGKGNRKDLERKCFKIKG